MKSDAKLLFNMLDALVRDHTVTDPMIAYRRLMVASQSSQVSTSSKAGSDSRVSRILL
jgi:hypothetical protein